ncbi:FAD-dependent monooxygenase [Xylophilus sp.]|uniref:FAD-dependent monooxygenase n=1 Tax=Xylophilus sp. TaxID=2653893 RepID=UPI0013B96BF7|nr:FAD-dependent monooxygenase [Xylophilus sp.]KAF1049861.1 MAG: 2-octaprenylphenol hydroxylase [Xylophilus sp.]
MAQSFDVCIRGAGIVGRALALLLARERLRVALVADADAVAAGTQDIRAYALNAASRGLLQSLRSWPEAAHATPVAAMEVQGDRGGQVRFDARSQGADALAWIVDVPALQAVLADAVRFQPQVETVAGPVDAALTVVCEGRDSTLRTALGVDFDTTPYGQNAIAARLRTALPHGGVARQWFLPSDGIVALLPLGGPQGDTVALVWSVAQNRAAELLALDPAAFEAQLAASIASAEAGALTLLGERTSWPLARATADRWSGRFDGSTTQRPRSWVLAGDAAHTVHPLAGQGLNLGLADAVELAAVLRVRDDWRSVADPRLLRRYERARKTATLAMGLATDGLQQLFAQPGGAWKSLRNRGMQGFERAGLLKAWTARQAGGITSAAGAGH